MIDFLLREVLNSGGDMKHKTAVK